MEVGRRRLVWHCGGGAMVSTAIRGFSAKSFFRMMATETYTGT